MLKVELELMEVEKLNYESEVKLIMRMVEVSVNMPKTE